MENTTYIFVNRLRYERLRYHEACQIKTARYVAIFDKEFYARVPPKAKGEIDRIVELQSFDYTAVKSIVEEEIKLTGSPKNVSIICWEEEALLFCGQIRRELGIPGPTDSDLEVFRDKLLMKSRLSDAGIRVPRFRAYSPSSNADNQVFFNEIVRDLRFPMIVKPIDGFGAADTHKIEDSSTLLTFLQDANHASQKWNFEEFISGEVHYCDCLIQKGETVFVGAGRHIGTPLEFVKGTSMAAYVLDPKSEVYQKIAQFNRAVLNALKPPTVVTHLEVIITADGDVVFLEIAARPAGGEIWRTYDRAFGLDLVRTLLEIELGYTSSAAPTPYLPTAWAYFARKAGIVSEINAPALKSEYQDFDWKVFTGDIIHDSNFAYDRSGSVVFSDKEFSILKSDAESLYGYETLVLN